MPVTDQYFKIFDSLYVKYGPRVAVLFEQGDFYNLYGSDDDDDPVKEVFYNIIHLLTLNKQSPKSERHVEVEKHRDNPHVAGFPVAVLDMKKDILLENDYWVAICEQKSVGTASKKTFTRDVTRIIHQSTHLESTKEVQGVLVIYHDVLPMNQLHVAGMAYLEMTTGQVLLYHGESTEEENELAREDVERWILSYRPTQIVIVDQGEQSTFRGPSQVLYTKKAVKLANPAYQEQLLRYYYSESATKVSNLTEYFGIATRPYARLALMYLLEFLHGMDKSIIHCLREPAVAECEDTLVLEKNAVKQLGVEKITSRALGIIRCQTAMGRALLAERLMRPSSRVDVIEDRLRFAECCDAKIHLNLPDMRLVFRRIASGRCNLATLRALVQALRVIRTLPEQFSERMSCAWKAETLVNLDIREAQAELESIIDVSAVESDICVFKDRLLEEQAQYRKLKHAITFFLDKLNGIVGRDSNGVPRVFTKVTKLDGLVFCGKKSVVDRYLDRFFWEKFSVDIEGELFAWDKQSVTSKLASGSRMFVHSQISDEFNSLEENLTRSVEYEIKTAMADFYAKHRAALDRLVTEVARLDVGMATTEYARKNKYVRPKLVTDNSSYFIAKNLRHPVIEKILIDSTYVPNDFKLTQEIPGIVLYGINSSGKSSAMRAIGIAVVMAQAGLHVPCDEFEIAPFRNMMTRIMGGDDIMRGESSYTVEIMECIPIATRATQNTLVLGDEIGHGTEVTSGSSLVSALVEHMAEKNIKFFIATHMRALCAITRSTNVAHKHIHVTETDDGGFVFDRTIRDGPGPDTYGLAIAKYLRMPLHIMHNAYRKYHFLKNRPESLVSNISRNNPLKLHPPVCATEGCTNPPEEEDHIEPRYNADENGFINGTPVSVHNPQNLQKLCKQCHREKTRQDMAQLRKPTRKRKRKLIVDYYQ